MADRIRRNQGITERAFLFARSLLLVVVIVAGVPAVLLWAARQRLGGSAPFHGVASPAEWRLGTIRDALTSRLTEQTIADVMVRTALVVAWVAIIVLVVTIIAEIVHMVRHDGLAMPDVRGFGLSQRTARVIAAGLLVVVPLVSSPAGVLARDGGLRPTPVGGEPARELVQSAAAPSRETPADANIDDPTIGGTSHYTVRPGDSVYGIAERIAGPRAEAVADYAERMLELNLGRRMPDGRQFSNAAFVDVGWVLEMPGAASDAGVHVVERGETLWSIADEELGDPARWPEVFDANEGRTFDDGRSLTDPDLIQPGWDLVVPTGDETGAGADRLEPAEVTHVVEPIDVPVDARPEPAPTVEGDVGVVAAEAAIIETPAQHLVEAADDGGAPGVADTPATSTERAVVWPGASTTARDAARAGGSIGGSIDDTNDDTNDDTTAMITMQGAAMLSAGVLALLAVRRRRQLRRARPRARLPVPAPGPAATERALRSSDPGERFVRVEAAIRASAHHLIARGARVAALAAGPDGHVELWATAPVDLPAPWRGSATRWHIDAATPLELLLEAGDRVPPPCPALVQLGIDDGGCDVYVDLEALEAIEIGGPGAHADAIVAAIATTLAGSVLAEVTTLVGLGVPDEAFLRHRLFVPARDIHGAFEAAAGAIGATASMSESTFELRAKAIAGETWEPAVVLVGSAAGTVTLPANRSGLAIVSASPLLGPSSRLAPDRDAWVLMPAGIRLRPIGLTPDDIAAIAELAAVADAVPAFDRASLSEHTLVGADDLVAPGHDGERWADGGAVPALQPESVTDDQAAPLDHALMVTLFGGVSVVDPHGNEVAFERSKTRELVAWLATHRSRSTRIAARTALWELDVRDATFANVVSEARRSLARLVEPPEGEEWVGRTMTEALPLHPMVMTDADLVEHALGVARLQPPAQAIATLSPAVALIDGMPFAGTSYLWPDSEGITSNLVLLATTATAELAAHCLSIGDVQGVFAATGRGLQVLPGHEELIALRMEAHAKAGDHAGVRQEWESYERVINNDPWSDGEPAPKLVALRRRLLQPSR